MCKSLLSYRLRAFSPGSAFIALGARIPATGRFVPSRNSQVRSLSQSTKPSCRSSKATFAELFAGIGGFHKALSSNGMRCVYANENDRLAAETYERNHCKNKDGCGNEGILSVDVRDIRDVVMSDIPDHTFLTGGFPCQSYSIAGDRMGYDCPKNGDHLERIGKIVAAKRPSIVLPENVKNFASPRFMGLETAQKMFDELGGRVYNAADFNLPQNRERILMVAVRKDIASEPFEMPDPPGRRAGLCLRDCLLTKEDMLLPENLASIQPTDLRQVGSFKVPIRKMSSKQVRFDWTETKDLPLPERGGLIHVGCWERPGHDKPRENDSILHPQGLARCLLTSMTGWYLAPWLDDEFVVRRLHPREMARIQGFPDSFRLPKFKTAAIDQFGNAVPPPMVDCIVKALMESYLDLF